MQSQIVSNQSSKPSIVLRVLLALSLALSFVIPLTSSPEQAQAIDEGTFSNLVTSTENSTVPTGETFALNVAVLLNAIEPGLLLPNTKLVIEYSPTITYVGSYGLTCAVVEGNAGNVLTLDVVEPTGNGSSIPDGFGPDTGLTIAGNFNFKFPVGTTPDAALGSMTVKVVDDGAVYKQQTISVNATAASEVWKVSKWSPTNNAIVDPTPANPADYAATFVSTVRNETQTLTPEQRVGFIYTDSLKYTQSIALPDDVYFPYTVADVKLAADDPAALIKLTPPAGIDPANLSFTARIVHEDGVRTLFIDWQVINLAQPTASLDFSVAVKDLVDWTDGHEIDDPNNPGTPLGSWYDPFERAGGNSSTVSVTRNAVHAGDISVANIVDPTVFTQPTQAKSTVVLRDTLPAIPAVDKPEGTTVDNTWHYFDKTYISEGGTEPDRPNAGKQPSTDKVDRGNRIINYALNGIKNMDDRTLTDFSIKDVAGSGGWDTALQSFVGVTVGSYVGSSKSIDVVPNPTEAIFPQLKYQVGSTWYVYGQVDGQAGNPDVTVTTTGFIDSKAFLADYKKQAAGEPSAASVNIVGVELYFKQVPRQFMAKTGAEPKFRFRAAVQVSTPTLPINNSATLSYKAGSVEKSVDSATEVAYDVDVTPSVNDAKKAYVERTTQVWDPDTETFKEETAFVPVGDKTKILPDDVIMYEVSVENNSLRGLSNVVISDTLDPRTKLLDPSDPRWAALKAAEYTFAHASGVDPISAPVSTTSSPIKFDTDAVRDPLALASGAYPSITPDTVSEYLNDAGEVEALDAPVATSSLLWAFEGNLEEAIWNDDNDPAVLMGPGGKVTVRYLATIASPDSADWPTGIDKPTGWDDPEKQADVTFGLRNVYTAYERFWGTIPVIPWVDSGSNSVQVIIPGIEVGLLKTPSAQAVPVGGTLDYTVTVNNNSRDIVGSDSRQALIGPSVIDLFPAGFTYSAIKSVKLINRDDGSKTITLPASSGLYTVTPIQQPDATTAEVRKGIEVTFDSSVSVYRRQAIEIVYTVQADDDWGDKFVVDGAPVSTLQAKNNVAVHLGTRDGKNITYRMVTMGEYGPTDATLTAWLGANGYDTLASPRSFVQNNSNIVVLSPILRPIVGIAPTNGLSTAKNIFTDGATGPIFEVTLSNADSNEVYKSTIKDSAVQVLIPDALSFAVPLDASGQVTAAGLAQLAAAIKTDHNSDGAAIAIASARVDAIETDDGAGTVTKYKRLTMVLENTTAVSNLDVATIQVPTELEADAEPDMFSASSEKTFAARVALIPNISTQNRLFYFTGDPVKSPEFKTSDVWDWNSLVDGVESNTSILYHRETPIPYTRTLISGSLPPETAVWNASTTTTRGSDFLVQVTGRNYGDADIVNGKLYALMPIGFLYKGVVLSEISVGVGSELTNTTPIVHNVGGMTLLEWDVAKLAKGYTAAGLPSSSLAQSGEIKVGIKVGSGQIYGQGNEFTSFLATQEVVLDAAGTPLIDGDNKLVRNYFHQQAQPTSNGVRDYRGNLVGFPTGGATENIRVAMTDERDSDFTTGFFDLNGDGDLEYHDYTWDGTTLTPKHPDVTVVDKAVRHTALLNLTGQFNMKFSKSIRSWDSSTDSWSAYSTGNSALETVRGGKVEYTLALTNEDDFKLANINLIDVFPYVDDKGTVLQSTVRGSTFDIFGAKAINLDVKKGTTLGTAASLSTSDYAAGLSTTSHMVLDNKRDSSTFTWDVPAGAGSFAMDTTNPSQHSTALKVDIGDDVSLLRGESIYVTFELDIPYNALVSNDMEKYPAYNTGAVDLEVQRKSDGAYMGAVMLESTRAGVIVKNTGTGIGDFVWRDLNEDGIQDDDEDGINGLIVELWQEKGSSYEKIGETMTDYYMDPDTNVVDTDMPGYYFFDSIADGTYRVKFSLPVDGDPTTAGYSSYEYSPEGQGDDPEKDSRAISDSGDPWYGYSEPVTISAATNPVDRTIDAGLICYGAMVGDMVWYDANENGLQDDFVDPTDTVLAGIGGVTVELYRVDVDGEVESTPWMTRVSHSRDTRDALDSTPEGYYAFGRLPVGDYQLRFDLPEEGYRGENGWRFSPAREGTDINVSSAVVDAVEGWTDQFSISGLEDNQLFWDCGLAYNDITIGHVVWHDVNGNGLQDDFTTINGTDVLLGIPDVAVHLYKDGARVASTVTDDEGEYLFDKLAPGDYSVEVALPEAALVDGSTNHFTTKFVDATVPILCSDVNEGDGITDLIEARGSNTSFMVADAGVATKPLPKSLETGGMVKTGDGLPIHLITLGALALVAVLGVSAYLRRKRDEA